MDYIAKIGGDGRVLIPAQLRRELHFEREDSLVLRVEGERLVILSLKEAAMQVQRFVQKQAKGLNLVERLSEMRKADHD